MHRDSIVVDGDVVRVVAVDGVAVDGAVAVAAVVVDEAMPPIHRLSEREPTDRSFFRLAVSWDPNTTKSDQRTRIEVLSRWVFLPLVESVYAVRLPVIR